MQIKFVTRKCFHCTETGEDIDFIPRILYDKIGYEDCFFDRNSGNLIHKLQHVTLPETSSETKTE